MFGKRRVGIIEVGAEILAGGPGMALETIEN